jgi:light-regulated signal transduction histidine kinase (bacteriophytochrome)
VRSPSDSKLATIVIDHLAEIAAGRCAITDQGIIETARSDPVLAEILTGLLFLHEDLAFHAAERDRALADAVAANRELEAFSYSVAHDLRAPLRGIDTFSQLLMEESGDKLDEDGKAYVGYIRESAQTMAQLIDDLLMLSRVARSDLRRERVDLSEMVRIIVGQLQRTEPERRLEPVIQDDVVAEGDARLLRVVMDNLLGNAWKFTGKKPLARIEFGTLPDTHPTVYFVRDNGAGFDMASAHKLFVAFQRLHTAAEFSGTGIGLATVWRIVSRHGGRVWAEGEVDRGATFYFTLEGQTRP